MCFYVLYQTFKNEIDIEPEAWLPLDGAASAHLASHFFHKAHDSGAWASGEPQSQLESISSFIINAAALKS